MSGDGAEAFADTLANRLQDLKPGATLGRMESRRQRLLS